MINILNAIERHIAALSAQPNRHTESSFLASYRRHVIDQHGKLEPPDFDRRRRVPIADIYVPTSITEDLPPERKAPSRPGEPVSMDVYELAARLDRSCCSETRAAARPPRRTCSCTTSPATRTAGSRFW
jgi:hypothetical protein